MGKIKSNPYRSAFSSAREEDMPVIENDKFKSTHQPNSSVIIREFNGNDLELLILLTKVREISDEHKGKPQLFASSIFSSSKTKPVEIASKTKHSYNLRQRHSKFSTSSSDSYKSSDSEVDLAL